MKKFIYLYFIFLFFLKISYAQYATNYTGNFDGTKSYIAFPNNSNLSPTDQITLEAWIYPTQLPYLTMAVIGKNHQTGYFLGVHTSKRVIFYPKGNNSLMSRASSLILQDKWTHIAATYDGVITSIYINGILDTSTAAITGPVSVNTDSLYVGTDRIGTHITYHFKGMLDNVRIWGTARTAGQVTNNKFSPLEIYMPSGEYAGLRASIQLDNSSQNTGGIFLETGYPRHVTYTYYANEAVNYLDYNNNLVLNGTTDYFTVSNLSGFNAIQVITVEAWIKRDTTGAQPTDQYIVNKSGGTNRFNYALWLNSSSGELKFKINSSTGPPALISSQPILNSQWTHVAAAYNSFTGLANLYINSKPVASGSFSGNPLIENDPDNLFIGGIGASSLSANKFKGQIDGVKIWKVERTAEEIRDYMLSDVTDDNCVYLSFDKNANSFQQGGSAIFAANTFAGSAHISSSHMNFNNELTSPVFSHHIFYSPYYKNSFNRFYIPDNDPSGIKDSIFVSPSGEAYISNVYVLMSHTKMSDIIINVTSPEGITLNLYNRKGANGNDLMTIFFEGALSPASLNNNVNGEGITTPFNPSIKPENSLSGLWGGNRFGWWKLEIIDVAGGDIGYVHGWGLEPQGFTYPTLQLNVLIEGRYNNFQHTMKEDTVTVLLRDAISPYPVWRTSIEPVDSEGKGIFIFGGVFNAYPYYVVVQHRNSIETWSSNPVTFEDQTAFYDFRPSASKAFGSNMILVDEVASTQRYAIYSGDVNQDGIVDLIDGSLINNDAFNFVSGYVVTDLNGDEIVDLQDASIADNNILNFVTIVRP